MLVQLFLLEIIKIMSILLINNIKRSVSILFINYREFIRIFLFTVKIIPQFIVNCTKGLDFRLFVVYQRTFRALLQCLKLVFSITFISNLSFILLGGRVLSQFHIFFYIFLQFLGT